MGQESIIVECDNCGTKNRVPRDRLHEKPVCGKCKSSLRVVSDLKVPINVTDQTFNQEVISYPGSVLVDCWAPWCGPCRVVAPVLDQLAAEYSGRIKIAKLNVDENPITASQYGIQSIPTMLIFKNGNQVNKLVGALPKKDIEGHLAAIL
ncbi:thioredoxin TrxC [Deltaproteobacteria bacterium]|nr:thioredoxin TrxC [Deltaproteobacteria bacterium]